MTTFISIINAIALILISAIHFYWAMGGKWGGDRVFPEIKSSKPIRPSRLATAFVAFIFLGFALVYLDKMQVIEVPFPNFIEQYGTTILGVIFIIRAIGEFKYIGFTKTIKDSKFAEMDTKYYSPLCLILGFNSLIINYL
jgi:hypothetical protein